MSLEADVRLLAHLPLLSHFEMVALDLLALSSSQHTFGMGETLAQQGDLTDGGWILQTGSVVVEMAGEIDPFYQTFTPPYLFGDFSLIVETQWPMTIIAREPTKVLKITRDDFRRMLRKYPEGALVLHRKLKQKMGLYVENICHIGPHFQHLPEQAYRL